jgi:hypothetical protein
VLPGVSDERADTMQVVVCHGVHAISYLRYQRSQGAVSSIFA